MRSSQVVEKLGVHITAEQPVTVYGSNRRYQTTDTYLALPVVALGVAYRALGYRWLQQDLLSQVAVVATEDNTSVTFVPSAAVQRIAPPPSRGCQRPIRWARRQRAHRSIR
jgi:hypothetical protein